MHPRRAVPEPLLRLAALQAGMVTRQQAIGHGVTPKVLDRLVRSAAWTRVCPGLFATTPGPPSWEALAWGGTLVGGPFARLGPEASGYLYGLVRTAPRPIDVLVPVSTCRRVPGPWRFLREADGVRPRRSPGSPPRLTPECTVLDLAASRSPEDVVGVVTAAVQKGLTTPDRLRSLVSSRARQRHRRLLSGMLAEVEEGVRSYLEMRYLHDVEVPHGLPHAEPQSTREDLPYHTDVKYRRFALIVELDGRIGHQGEGRFRDLRRDNQHALRDELTLRYGYADVTGRPCAVAYQVYCALRKRGYAEPFQRCDRCAGVPETYLRSS